MSYLIEYEKEEQPRVVAVPLGSSTGGPSNTKNSSFIYVISVSERFIHFVYRNNLVKYSTLTNNRQIWAIRQHWWREIVKSGLFPQWWTWFWWDKKRLIFRQFDISGVHIFEYLDGKRRVWTIFHIYWQQFREFKLTQITFPFWSSCSWFFIDGESDQIYVRIQNSIAEVM